MITDAFITVIYSIISVILSPLSLLPDVTANSSITAGINAASGYLASANVFFPVDTVLEILAFVVVFEIAYLAYKVIMWVLRKIPGIS